MTSAREPRERDAASVDFGELRSTLERFVRRHCPGWLAAQREDLVQNACLRIVDKVGAGEESRLRFSSYLWKVAHSVVLDELRRRRRHPEAELDSLAMPDPVSPAAVPEARAAAAEMRDAIADGVERLSESRRGAVSLYLHGFSLKDSARILGMTPKQVDNQRYRGLAELRAYLRERGYEP